jgi:acyl-CoA thioesterase
MAKIDPVVARQAFDHALAHHEQAFGQFFLAKLLGFEISYPEDTCRVEFPVTDFMYNPQDSLHGGVIALAMDVSMGHLLNKLQGPGATLEMKVQYLRAVRSGPATATGRVLRRGSSVAFLESRLTDHDGQVAAVATSTWKTSPAASPVRE